MFVIVEYRNETWNFFEREMPWNSRFREYEMLWNVVHARKWLHLRIEEGVKETLRALELPS